MERGGPEVGHHYPLREGGRHVSSHHHLTLLLLPTPSRRFRWVVYHMKRLRRSFPASIRSALNDLPKSLDETYEHTLLNIHEEKRDYAQRLFQCLTASFRSLRVEELAEILAVRLDVEATPRFNADWRPIDAEGAVLSACSNLVAVVDVVAPGLFKFPTSL